jgi:hypothetical protein
MKLPKISVCFAFVALIGALGAVPVAVASEVALPENIVAGPIDAKSAATPEMAAAIASEYDHPVVIEATTTATSQISALPDGTMHLVSHAQPVRVQRNGEWVDVDASLKKSGDIYAPASTTVPVKFSGGGDNQLARIQTPTGKWVTESWPLGALPTPTVEGSVATYPNVLPGVDLKLTASVLGMSEVLVVKSAAAAANPDLASLEFGISGATVSDEGAGAAAAAAVDGSEVQSSAPMWWDSSELVREGPARAGTTRHAHYPARVRSRP